MKVPGPLFTGPRAPSLAPLECKIGWVLLKTDLSEVVAHAGEGARGPIKSDPTIEALIAIDANGQTFTN